jgi:hypothetical protein
LLKLQTAVGGYKNFKSCVCGTSKQLAILQSSPAVLLNCADVMSSQMRRKMTR